MARGDDSFKYYVQLVGALNDYLLMNATLKNDKF